MAKGFLSKHWPIRNFKICDMFNLDPIVHCCFFLRLSGATLDYTHLFCNLRLCFFLSGFFFNKCMHECTSFFIFSFSVLILITMFSKQMILVHQ